MNGLKYAVIMFLIVFTGVLASWRDAGALPFSFQINRFQINQSGDLVNDSFDDGLVPPFGPFDAAGCNLTNSCTYQTPTNGTFGLNDETGGSLALNSVGAENVIINGTPVQRIGARRRQNIQRTNGAFFVQADFAGILPRDTAALGAFENFRITLLDTGSSGNSNNFLALMVRNEGGSPRIVFRDVSNRINLSSILLADALSPEITLRLDVDANGLVTALFDPDGPGGVLDFDMVGANTGQIYVDEDVIRARFEAFSPVAEPGTLLILGFGLVGVGLIRRRVKAA